MRVGLFILFCRKLYVEVFWSLVLQWLLIGVKIISLKIYQWFQEPVIVN